MANFEEKKSRLPAGYTELQWIENPNQAYITIGYDLQTTISLSWEMKFKMLDTAENNYFIGNTTNYLYYNTNAKNIYFYNKTNYGGGQNIFSVSDLNGDHIFKFDLSTKKADLDGISQTAHNYSSSTPRSLLFAKATSNSARQISNFRLYSFTINTYEYVPAIRDSDGQVGIFCLTSWETSGNTYFLSSSNSNNFEAGPKA